MKKVVKKSSWKKATTTSAAETLRLGRRIGKALRAGDVVALSGGLGAGKTTLVKGVAQGLGVRDKKAVSSPTFTVIHEYQGRERIFHLDWYRLQSVRGTDRQMAEECMAEQAVTLIEWPERGAKLLPRSAARIRIDHAGGCRRTISWKGKAFEYSGL